MDIKGEVGSMWEGDYQEVDKEQPVREADKLEQRIMAYMNANTTTPITLYAIIK